MYNSKTNRLDIEPVIKTSITEPGEWLAPCGQLPVQPSVISGLVIMKSEPGVQ